MQPRVFTGAERPDLAERAVELDAEVWPEYNMHGDVLSLNWRRMRSEFAEFQFVLYDEDADTIVAEGHSVPLRWDGTLDDLPAGIDGVFERAFSAPASNAGCAMAIEISPGAQSRGLSSRMLAEMHRIVTASGLGDLIAPVRPSWKERYPLVPIERYAAWTREDGLPLDPWLRVHVRAGGELLRPEPRSLRISGTVAEWEEWTAMAFPESAEYVFPHGLATLAVDREADVALYYEPNVWVRHPARALCG